MKTAYLNVLIILLATSISGCSEDSGATITVTEASSIDEGEGFCGYGDDEECHSFVVSIANSGSEDFSTNMFYWDAVSDDGGVYSTPDVALSLQRIFLGTLFSKQSRRLAKRLIPDCGPREDIFAHFH